MGVKKFQSTLFQILPKISCGADTKILAKVGFHENSFLIGG